MKLIDDILDFLGVQINKNAKKMYNDTIKSDNLSEKEIKSKIDEFAKSTIKATNKALNDIGIKQSISKTENIIISDNITLSQNLYFRLNEVEQATTKTIKKHLKEQKTIKDLSLKIYQGYDFKKDDLDLKKTLPKYLFNEAVNLANKQKNKVKTKNLKTAYNQVLKAKSDEARNKVLKIAMYEKGRFYANRIAQNEVNLEYMREKAKEILNNDDIETIAIKMSKTHPRTDICDYFSSVDLYGLGKGIYPKDKAPLPPFHPFCRCRLIPKFSESAKDAKFNPKAEKEFIKSLAPYKQAQILGSKRRAFKFLHSDLPLIEFYNQTKPHRYKTTTIGEILGVSLKSQINSLFAAEKKSVVIANSDIFGDNKAVYLSSDTLQTHKAKHPEITADDYAKIPQILSGKKKVFVKDKRNKIILKSLDKNYCCIVKNIENKDEIFITTLFTIGNGIKKLKKELKRILKNGYKKAES